MNGMFPGNPGDSGLAVKVAKIMEAGSFWHSLPHEKDVGACDSDGRITRFYKRVAKHGKYLHPIRRILNGTLSEHASGLWFHSADQYVRFMVTRVFPRATAGNAKRLLMVAIEELSHPVLSIQAVAGSVLNSKKPARPGIPLYVLPPVASD